MILVALTKIQGHLGHENKKNLLFVECLLLYARCHAMHFINVNLFKSSQRSYYFYLTDEKVDAQ